MRVTSITFDNTLTMRSVLGTRQVVFGTRTSTDTFGFQFDVLNDTGASIFPGIRWNDRAGGLGVGSVEMTHDGSTWKHIASQEDVDAAFASAASLLARYNAIKAYFGH